MSDADPPRTKPSEPELLIRPFQVADLARLQEIRQAAFAPVFASLRQILGADVSPAALGDIDSEQARLLESLCQGAGGATMLVAVHAAEATSADPATEIVGFASYTVDIKHKLGEIGLNAVHPDYAGRGIGTQVYEYILEQMRSRGAIVATVSTGGDPSHAPARRAYEKAGFGLTLPSVALYRRL